VVLTDVSVSVGRGEVVGLLGPNGAGKTTCFYSVMGLVKPDSGRIMLDGEDITAADVSPRDPGPRLSAAGNLDLPRHDGREEHPRRARAGRARQGRRGAGPARQAARRIRPHAAARARRRWRCRAASGAAPRSPARSPPIPTIMLLDEPFAGIDPISISTFAISSIQLKNARIGVLITDHNVRETLDIVDRGYIIYDGRVLFAGSPEELVRDENVRRLYLGESFEL
jgi:lipopolysaccharide export system ATP-binding protein